MDNPNCIIPHNCRREGFSRKKSIGFQPRGWLMERMDWFTSLLASARLHTISILSLLIWLPRCCPNKSPSIFQQIATVEFLIFTPSFANTKPQDKTTQKPKQFTYCCFLFHFTFGIHSNATHLWNIPIPQ